MKKSAPKMKRGRPRKVLPWVLRLGDNQSKWNDWFRSVGNPIELRWSPSGEDEVEMRQQQSLPPREHDIYGRSTRPTRDKFGESADHESTTQLTDPLLSLQQELAANESIVLSNEWRLYLEYMDLIVNMLRAKDQRSALKELVLEDARSRYWEDPPDLTSLGTPAEFRAVCADPDSYVEMQLKCSRREQIIKVSVYSVPVPPDEPEDLDEAEEPDGHWEGLRWIPDTPKKDGV